MNKIFSNPFKKLVSSIVSASILLTSALPMAHAQVFPCLGVTAKNGDDDRCAAVDIGGTQVAYPKLQWSWVSDLPAQQSNVSRALTSEDESVALGNRAALVLGLKPEQVANAVAVAPANVPYVVARYDNTSAKLRIDVFKLEKGIKNGVPRVGVLQAVFTPSHGDQWKANRSYISPDAVKYGLSPGVNPFQAFAQPGSELFNNISFNSAQVAVGHAMRMVGAPVAVMSVPEVSVSQQKKSKRSGFKKTVTVTTTATTRTRWFVAQPTDALSRSTTLTGAAYCVTPGATRPDGSVDCPSYAVAVSGVSFEEFEGGTFNSESEQAVVDVQKKSGYSFGSFLGAIVGAIAVAALMPLGGPMVVAFALTTDSDWKTNSYSNNAAVVETSAGLSGSAPAKVMSVGGASLNAQYPYTFNTALPKTNYTPPAPQGTVAQRVASFTYDRTVTSFSTTASTPGPTFKSFSATVLGGCGAGALSTQCSTPGLIPRADQFLDSNLPQVVRDTQNMLVRETR